MLGNVNRICSYFIFIHCYTGMETLLPKEFYMKICIKIVIFFVQSSLVRNRNCVHNKCNNIVIVMLGSRNCCLSSCNYLVV